MSPARARTARAIAMCVIALCAVTGCDSPSRPSPAVREFVVEAVGERFVVRVTDTETIRLAIENMQGRNTRFPMGALRTGDGGFNTPWTWHLEPDSVRLVEVAIEVCDGRPSYVETHQADYRTYCPWGARIVAEK